MEYNVGMIPIKGKGKGKRIWPEESQTAVQFWVSVNWECSLEMSQILQRGLALVTHHPQSFAYSSPRKVWLQHKCSVGSRKVAVKTVGQLWPLQHKICKKYFLQSIHCAAQIQFSVKVQRMASPWLSWPSLLEGKLRREGLMMPATAPATAVCLRTISHIHPLLHSPF